MKQCYTVATKRSPIGSGDGGTAQCLPTAVFLSLAPSGLYLPPWKVCH